MDSGSKMKNEDAIPPEAKMELTQGIGRLPRVDSSFENPVAFRTVLLSINELMKRTYNNAAYRFPIFTRGNIVDVNMGRGTFHYFALVDSGQYLPCKIKDESSNFQSLQENLPVIVKGYFNLESPLNRTFAFEIRFNVIELHHAFSQKDAKIPNQVTKKSVPEKIRSVGLITSPNSEAISDFHEGLKKNRHFLKVEIHGVNLLNPESICAGIKDADAKGYDVLVITRGGGPDLYLFNDPSIVTAVTACKTFTITGLGHANNETECDRVSDMSVETPTSAGVQIGKLVSSKFFTEKNKVLNPPSPVSVGRANPWIRYSGLILGHAAIFIVAVAATVFRSLLEIGKRILFAVFSVLAVLLILLLFSLLLRECT
jgi:hypothetical protein